MAEPFSPKTEAFLAALRALCQEHKVCLAVSGYEALQVWDLLLADADALHCQGIEDCTTKELPA